MASHLNFHQDCRHKFAPASINSPANEFAERNLWRKEALTDRAHLEIYGSNKVIRYASLFLLSSRFNFLQHFSSAAERSQLIFCFQNILLARKVFQLVTKYLPERISALSLFKWSRDAYTKFSSPFQVLDERMHHIDYTPAKPEPFYKATGRELQPRTIGEENGVIVYNYMPISASHYVSQLQMLCFSLRRFISVCRRTLSAEVQCQGRSRNFSRCLPNIGWVGVSCH